LNLLIFLIKEISNWALSEKHFQGFIPCRIIPAIDSGYMLIYPINTQIGIQQKSVTLCVENKSRRLFFFMFQGEEQARLKNKTPYKSKKAFNENR